ncbi:hypothetical protein [Candidatus Amarobacter glycogenicus]|uniref:hypothetical protein n=1 Tax=Candidatus Amarobacter glycogenicus TaxID=3140699 RepID=UPI002A0F0744|nr:hypothetical protein [Dehalococcoidia bacterium]
MEDGDVVLTWSIRWSASPWLVLSTIANSQPASKPAKEALDFGASGLVIRP